MRRQRYSATERIFAAVVLWMSAWVVACPRRCPAQDLRIPMTIAAELVAWWKAGQAGCAFGDVKGDTTIITRLVPGIPCREGLGEITTGPPIPHGEYPVRLQYLQWVLAQRPALAFTALVYDTMTVRGVLLPRVIGVRRVRLPVLGG